MQKVKKIAAINDLSGASRCSLTVAIPIISALGLQCLAMPTAVLSNHTGYDSYFFEDFTNQMTQFTDNWKKMQLTFDCIYSGFLGSEQQIETVIRFIKEFRTPQTKIVIDPVMGDNGKIYPTYTDTLCTEMKKLASVADIVTPNITEACVLSGYDYRDETPDSERLRQMGEKICHLGAKNVIITGIKNDTSIASYVYTCDGQSRLFQAELIPVYYNGTGDIFASVLSGLITKGKDVFAAAEFATDFVHKIAAFSHEIKTDSKDGICFEPFLHLLTNLKGE